MLSRARDLSFFNLECRQPWSATSDLRWHGPCDWDHAAEALYSTFVDDLADRLPSRSGAEEAVFAHQARLRSMVATRGGDAHTPEVLCETYSPELQLHLLGLDPIQAPGPILDVGCGESGLLVRHMQRLGRGDVYGWTPSARRAAG